MRLKNYILSGTLRTNDNRYCDKLGKDDMRWAPLVCELPLCVSGLPRVSRLDYCVIVMWVLSVC